MPEEKEDRDSRETMPKTLRLYTEDVEYLIRLLPHGPLTPGACIHDAVRNDRERSGSARNPGVISVASAGESDNRRSRSWRALVDQTCPKTFR